MNLIILDIETSSLDPSKGEILEIGAVRIATGEAFEVKIHPLRIKDADPEALAVNGYNKKDWEEAFLLPHALQLLSEFVDLAPAYLMAYGVSFDRSFLEKAYRDCNLPYPFHYHHLDLMTLAWAHSKEGDPLSLSAVASRLGVAPEAKPHRALAGAVCSWEVYQNLTPNL